MRRRELLFASVALLAVPLASAQQGRRNFRIGFLNPTSAPEAQRYLAEFRRGMQELGYAEGREFSIEERYAYGKNERLPDLAAELVRSRVDVILASTTNAASAIHKATTTIPVVFVAVSDPVASGFAASLAQPGGNMTGLSNFAGDLAPKRLELLKSVVPRLSSVAFLVNPGNPLYAGLQARLRAAADQVGVRLVPVNAASAEEMDSAFASMRREQALAVVIGGDVYHFQQQGQIASAALKHRIASISPFGEYTEAGCLMSYGTNVAAQFRRIAAYVDKIMKGAQPGDLPIEQPAVFEFVINRKTARALGITIPQAVLPRADRVIE